MNKQSERYQLSELLSAMERAGSVLLFPHISPDGDTIGSTLALKMMLTRLKKPVTVILDDTPPRNLSFLPDIYSVRQYAEAEGVLTIAEDTLAIAVDVSSDERLGRSLELFSRIGANAQIDHHPTNPGFAKINLIDDDAPASAVLVHRLFEAFGLPLQREEAICLYTGLATDTGNFVYKNTDAEAFSMMSRLMEAGLPIATYARILFRCKEKEHIALLGQALPTMRYLCGGEIAGMHVSAAQIREAGAVSEHADGVVDYAIDAAGVKIAYFARETENGCVRCSLRALTPYRVDTVAEKFGGGGHQLAAGCLLDGPLDQAVLRIEAALQEAYLGGGQE
ncbi:MAG: bifunctional oligoribonuclease/PAP phosphatase NrnA [Clostridiales bacterium]|nr:bifunctional oligoribonuclease/PAP phosphatase NrnA [Clostridiales bacterium]